MQKKINGLVIGLTFFWACLFVGCVPQTKVITVSGQQGYSRNYVLGKPMSALIGEPIFEIRSGLQREGYKATSDYFPPQHTTADGGMNYLPITKGRIFGLIARINDTTIVVSDEQYEATAPFFEKPMPVALQLNNDGQVMKAYFRQSSLSPIGGLPWDRDFRFRKSDTMWMNESRRVEMIFTGLTGSTLKAVYREYGDQSMRPAFTTDLQFNLDESKVIAYRTIKIQVSNATNSRLEYTVISDDNLTWLQ